MERLIFILIALIIIKVFEWVDNNNYCPNCKTKMETSFDPIGDRMHYNCENCGEEWI